jgi:hypothetical protein
MLIIMWRIYTGMTLSRLIMADRRKNDPYNPEVRYYPETQDVVVWQRFRDMVLREALNPAWHCELTRLHHLNKITTEELLACQRYQREYGRWRKAQVYDPDGMPDWAIAEIEKNHKVMKETQGLLVGARCLHQLEDLVIRHRVLTDLELRAARRAMHLLKDFFGLGRNKR